MLRNRIRPSDQKDHFVYIRNWGASEIGASIVSKAERPNLSYVDLVDHTWNVGIDSISSNEEVTKVEQLRHDNKSCRRRNQHKVVLEGKFTTGFYPGAREYQSEVTLMLRCN